MSKEEAIKKVCDIAQEYMEEMYEGGSLDQVGLDRWKTEIQEAIDIVRSL